MLDAIFSDFDQPHVPGAAVAILQRGEVVALAAFGAADLTASQPCRATTSFRLASVSKQFTALLALMLAEQRAISLDAAIGAWLPELPRYAHAATLRQLLTHTSGLADYEDHIPAGRVAQLREPEIPGLLPPDAGRGLLFTPGAAYRYSNTGYVLLALWAERVAGQRFPDLLREQIFLPLGMRAVAYEEGGPPIAERAYGHTRVEGTWQRTDQSITSATLGDGGIYASVEDLARWLAALDERRIASPELLQAAFTPRVATDTGECYGYGWFIGAHRGAPMVHHDGTTIGFRNAVVRLPERRLSAAVLTNRSHADPTSLALAALDAYVAAT